ncbi:MAG: hypothetical protein WAU70_03335 [Flavobacteriales bacterium]
MTVIVATAVPADRDAVMCWLQNCEMKDRKLGDARSGRLNAVHVSSTIDRLRQCAYAMFPNMDRNEIDLFVGDYVDPQCRLAVPV